MDAILKEFQNVINTNINLIKDEHNKFILQTKELEKKCNLLQEENTKLTNIINELNKEKKAKASSTIWESMNTKLAEKDNIIEQLKKDVEFYKRTGPKTNIAEKWQSNISKSNSSDSNEANETMDAKKTKEEKTPILNKSVEKEIKLTDEEPKVVEEVVVKEKIVVEDENVDDADDVDGEEEQEDEPVVKKSKKHKSKDKSKDKSEKKKKKKKKTVEEENE